MAASTETFTGYFAEPEVAYGASRWARAYLKSELWQIQVDRRVSSTRRIDLNSTGRHLAAHR